MSATSRSVAVPREGAAVGALVGLVAAVIGVAAGQWLIVAAIPAGAAAGAVAGHWIRADGPIPVRAVLVPTLIADVVGAYAIVLTLSVAVAIRGGDGSSNLIADTLGFGILALAFAGIPAFLAITPFAWAAALLLRRRLRVLARRT